MMGVEILLTKKKGVTCLMKEELIKKQIAELLREAEKAHLEYQKELGVKDKEWAEWYARFIVEKLKGTELI